MVLARIALIALALCLLGCGSSEQGRAAIYRWPQEKIEVTMPANAPFMSQQFFAPAGYPTESKHLGFDLRANRGLPILAAAAGRVVRSYYEPLFGNRITIDHGTDESGEQVETHYAHLHVRLVESGQRVARGDQIGTMGSTGLQSLNVHLHFEVRTGRDGQRTEAQDPNLFWMDGVGRFTCFDRAQKYPDQPFRITSPTTCY